jgi:hypothetical protein
MSLDGKALDDLTEADLFELKTNGVSEGPRTCTLASTSRASLRPRPDEPYLPKWYE